MKNRVLLLFLVLLLGNNTLLKAQCYGVVKLDASSTSIPTSSATNSFTINTTNANELILIAYDGWGDNGLVTTTGTGPITVDGNPATYLNTAFSPIPNNTGGAETYAYSAPAAGVHNIVCNENGYNGTSGYDVNFAASFYCAGGTTPLTIASLTSVQTTVSDVNGGPITDNVTTTLPNSMVFGNAEDNEVTSASYVFTWTDATFLADTHTGDGVEASDAYQSECAAGVYSITATNPCPNPSTTSGDGGLAMVLVVIPPTLAANCFNATYTATNPTCGNTNGIIDVTPVGGAAPYTYTWTPNVTATASASNLSAGTYSIIVADAACQDTTLVVVLTTGGPVVTANITANVKCNGNCEGSATSTVTGGVLPYTYAWTPAGGATSAATGLCAGTYTLTVKDFNGCSSTATVTITQPPVLTAALAVTDPLCNGENGSITANAAGGTAPYAYAWAPSGGVAATANVSAGTYTLTITDANACTFTAVATVTQPTALGVTITGPQSLCAGSTATLIANVVGGTAPYAYSWSTVPAQTTSSISVTPAINTTYTVTVTDANNCEVTEQITVSIGSTLVATISGAASMCAGSSVTLCADVTGGTGGNSFTWQPGGNTSPCITVSPTATTTYTVTVVGGCGASTPVSATVSINPAPVVDYFADLYQGCIPLCIQFYNTTTTPGGNAESYSWQFGDGDSSHLKSPIYCYPDSGLYNVTLTVVSDSGCSATLKKVGMITVFSPPVAAYTLSPQPATILNPTVQFTDQSTDKYPIVYWFWNFGDATDSIGSIQHPTHTYQDTGTYCSSMIVVDEHGCTDTATNCLVVDPVFNLYIPSAFSPNGDGKDETFEPVGQYIKNFEMYIFDRWGNQMYHTTNITTGWNGTVNGSSAIAEEDTYVYKILITDSENKPHSYVGNVTLIK